MKKLILVLVVLALVGVCGLQIVKIRGRKVARSIDQLQLAEGLPVRVFVTEAQDFKETVAVSGEIAALTNVGVAAVISERIESLHVTTGQKVSKGELLVTLDAGLSKFELEQAEATVGEAEQNLARLQKGNRPEEIAMARADMERSEADLELADIELQRQDKLFAEEASSLQALQRIRAIYNTAKARKARAQANYEMIKQGARIEDIKAAESRLAMARALLGQAQNNYDDHFLRAPGAGVVSRNMFEVGDVVDKNVWVFRVVDVSRVYLDVDVSELYVTRTAIGMAVDVTVDVFGDRIFPGEIAEINPIANRADRSFATRVIIDNKDGVLKPGMFGRAHIVLDEAADVIALPSDAIYSDESGKYVLVVDGDFIARRKEVTLGRRFENLVGITGGLEAGVKVITLSYNLTAGAKVKVIGGGDEEGKRQERED